MAQISNASGARQVDTIVRKLADQQSHRTQQKERTTKTKF